MNRLLKAAAALLCAFGLTSIANAQLTTVTASHIYMGGTLIPTGTVTLTPVSSNGTPIAFAQGGGGLNAPTAFQCTITAGAITGGCPVPDAALTTPANIDYAIVICKTSPASCFTLQAVPGITGTTWPLDSYGPPAQTTNVQPMQLSYGTAAAPSPCVTPSMYIRNSGGGQLYMCIAGVPVLVSSAAVTAAAMQSALSAQTGCATAGNAWNPATNTCVAPSGSSSVCPLTNATNICITQSPYNASGAGATTTTTTGSTTSGTTTVVVGSTATFSAGNGIYIAGAGASGANYIGTVATVVDGTHLTLSSATSTTVAGGTVVQHDETAAFLAAFAAIAAGSQQTGTIWGPAGIYLVNGPLLDTGGANAVLPVPKIANYGGTTLVDISIKGFSRPNWETSTAGFVIQTALTTGNLFGGFDSAAGGGFPPFTNVKLEMENVTISAPVNTGAVMINATSILAFQGRHLLGNTPGSGTAVPTTTTGGFIYMPAIGNEVQNFLDDTQCGGFYTCYKLTEHTRAGSIFAAYGHNCFVVDNGNTTASVGSYEGNGVQVDMLWEQNCVNDIVGGAGPFNSPLNISLADLENTTGNGVLDTSNLLRGIININVSNASGSLTACNANVSGASHVTIHYLNCQPESSSASPPVVPSGLLEQWLSQEGQGTKLANSGADFTNSATTSNVTWTTPAGYTSPVATYNGTSSASVATSTTTTSFDGSLPFSACFKTTPSTFSGFGDQYVMSNLGTPLGWGIEIWGSTIGAGQVNFQLFSSGSNNIQLHNTAQTVTAGVKSQICVTYAGNKLAAGVTIYVNGSATATAATSDSLTGSTVSSNPLNIGANQGANFYHGAISDVRIFNRLLSATEVANLP